MTGPGLLPEPVERVPGDAEHQRPCSGEMEELESALPRCVCLLSTALSFAAAARVVADAEKSEEEEKGGGHGMGSGIVTRREGGGGGNEGDRVR